MCFLIMVTKTSHKEAVVGRLRALQSRCDTLQKFKENLAQFLEAFSYSCYRGRESMQKHVPPQHKTTGSLNGLQGGQEHLNMSIYTHCRIFQNACRAEKTWEENLWFFSARLHFFFEKSAKVRFWCGSNVLIYWCYCCSCWRHLHAPLLHVKLVLHPIRSLEAPLNHRFHRPGHTA